MTLTSYAKFEEKVTLSSKNDMRNLVNFNASREMFKNLHFDMLFLSKVYCLHKKIYSGVMCRNTEEWCKIWQRTDLCFEKWHKKYDPTLQSLKTCTLVVFTLFIMSKSLKVFNSSKVYNGSAKNYRGVMCHNNEGWCNI